jgi:TolB-like protein
VAELADYVNISKHVELIDASDGTQLWGAQFKEPFADVLAQPEELPLRISDQLRPILVRRRSRKGSKRAA